MDPELVGLENTAEFEASLIDDPLPPGLVDAHGPAAPAEAAPNEAGAPAAAEARAALGAPGEAPPYLGAPAAADAPAAAPDSPAEAPAAAPGSPGAKEPFHQRWVGKRLSHFRLMRVVGSGSLGVVFQVEDVNLKRIAAMKVLRRQLKGDAQTRLVDRFLLEARAAANIDHPSIAQVYEINEHSGWWYIAMEYLEGGSLHDLVKAAGPLPHNRAALMLVDAARGLAAAHEAGVIHRDVKPGNLMLTRRGRCKLVDFGLVKLDSAENPFNDDDRLVVGTPMYVAPEVAQGRGAVLASDVYSLSATLYALLAAEPPFQGKDVREVLRQHVKAEPPDVRLKAPNCPERVAALIQRGLAKDPAERPTAAQFAAALQAEVSDSGAADFTSFGSGAAGGLGAAPSSDANRSRLGASPGATGSSKVGMSPMALESGALEATLRTPQAQPRRPLRSIAGVFVGCAALLLSAWWAIASGWISVGAGAGVGRQDGPGAVAAEPGRPAAPALDIQTNGIGMRLALAPAGHAALGSPPTELGRNGDERMVHVTFSAPFRVSTTEVTQGQWARVMGQDYAPPEGVHPNEAGGRRFLGDSLPAYVSWFEAAEFCRRLSLLENAAYRLPTEAEWEYACRAGSSGAYAVGDALGPAQANVDADGDALGQASTRRPMPVASFKPNAWGLHDMHGNVMEWCHDWYADYPLGPLTDPQGPAEGKLRVIRGGSWDSYARVARSANRWAYPPELRTDYIGFRVVLEPNAAPPADAPSFLAERLAPPPAAAPEPAGESAAHADSVALDPMLTEYVPAEVMNARLRSVGSDTMDRLMMLWEKGFQRFHADVVFRHEGKGSGTAIPALAEGFSHFGPMSRPLRPAERTLFQSEYGYEPTQLRVAVDALAIFVHPSNPIASQGLTLGELDAIYSSSRKRGHADVQRWGDLGLSGPWAEAEIQVYSRNPASGTYGVFRELVLQGGEFKGTNRELVGSAQVIDAIALDRFGIGFGGIGYMRSGVAAAPLAEREDGPRVAPSPASAYNGAYPLARPLYLAINVPPNDPVSPIQREFLRFVYSKPGQSLVVEAGFYPLTADMTRAELEQIGLAPPK